MPTDPDWPTAVTLFGAACGPVLIYYAVAWLFSRLGATR
jgi:hypothetical protein